MMLGVSPSFIPYHEEVSQLEKRIISTYESRTDYTQANNYIGEGAESYVHRLESDPQIVAKFPRVGTGSTVEIRRGVRKLHSRLIRGIGCAGLEQMVGHSEFTPSAVLTKYAGERDLDEVVDTGEIEQVTKEEYKRVLGTFRDMQNRQLSTDDSPANILYVPQSGFTVVDYHTSQENPQTLEEKILEFAGPTMLVDDSRKGSRLPDYTTRYLDACVEVFDDAMGLLVEKDWKDCGFIPPA